MFSFNPLYQLNNKLSGLFMLYMEWRAFLVLIHVCMASSKEHNLGLAKYCSEVLVLCVEKLTLEQSA